MKKVNYNTDADAVSLNLSSRKAPNSLELTEHILVDLADNGSVVGLEILDASEEISKIFGRKIKKSEIKNMLCSIREEPNNEYLLQFRLKEKASRIASLLIPVYKSPVLA